MKNPVIAAKSGAAQMGALNHNYKGNDWTNDQIKQLRKLCVVGYGITKIANTIEIESDVASRRTVHDKIFELGIKVNISGRKRGTLQMLTKKYG